MNTRGRQMDGVASRTRSKSRTTTGETGVHKYTKILLINFMSMGGKIDIKCKHCLNIWSFPTANKFKKEEHLSGIIWDIAGFDNTGKLIFGIEINNSSPVTAVHERNVQLVPWCEFYADDVQMAACDETSKLWTLIDIQPCKKCSQNCRNKKKVSFETDHCCTDCGFKLGVNDKFCGNCGKQKIKENNPVLSEEPKLEIPVDTQEVNPPPVPTNTNIPPLPTDTPPLPKKTTIHLPTIGIIPPPRKPTIPPLPKCICGETRVKNIIVVVIILVFIIVIMNYIDVIIVIKIVNVIIVKRNILIYSFRCKYFNML